MSKQYLIRLAGIISISGLIVVFIGNGCSQEFVTWNGNSKDLSSSGGPLVGSAGNPSNDIPVIPGAKTASLVYSNQVLNHLTACIGVAKPSDSTVQMYEQKKGSISLNGAANTVTSPMMMAITSIAGEVCNDLINQERASTPRVFQGVDLNAGSLPSDGALSDVITRVALSCWQRNETADERQRLLTMVNSSVGNNEAQASRKASLMICTAMLSSLDALLN